MNGEVETTNKDMIKILFTIWEGNGITLKRGSDPYTFDVGAIKVLEFYAASWNEACQRQYDYYGWGQYKLQDDWEEIK